MNIREAIDKTDSLQPNQYPEEIKVEWLSALDSNIHTDIIEAHEYNDGEEEISYEPYSVDEMTQKLIVPFPYDELYPAYIKMKIDEMNGETARYNNSAAMFNAYYLNFEKYWHKHHKPVNKHKFRIWG